MDKSRVNLLARLSYTFVAMKNAGYVCQTAFVLSVAVMPIVGHTATNQSHSQTYVIPTYGGDALLPAVRQQLSTSRDGGTVATYQGKLVLQTTPANYQAVQQLLAQIDSQPQALTVSVRVGNDSRTQYDNQQGQVVITSRGIQGTGIINQSNNQRQGSSLYQVQTLSGSAASIGTSTLWSLAQSYYPTASVYSRSLGQIVIQQQVLLPTTQGISVTPRLLPSGQVEVKLSQVEERLARSNSSYNRYGMSSNSIQGQSLNSTFIVPRGQWVTIGQIVQNSQNQQAGGRGYGATNSYNSVPISLLVQ
ncbi:MULTISPECIES: hypothetical protein [Psychrobacter]|uniref:Type II and III secretion system family protein n=1 Tax=Psychrobacter alimentarius TaxID=261164 RepID=A0ABM5ZUD2_9GAMM|nr:MULTISPECIES: hypothetical protein [Psychrobacter]AMT95685.1 hypothetical protein A3K91_0046 [Psychrobacter alimentarius]